MPTRHPVATLLFGAALLLAAPARSAPPAAPAAPGDIVGTWEPEKTAENGLGVLFRAAPDGALFVTFGAVVDGTWSLRDGVLRLAVKGESTPQEIETRVEGDVLVQKKGTNEARLRRLGKASPSADPLVGCWQGPPVAEGGPSPVLEFGRTGNVHIRVPLKSEQGTWKVSAGRLTLVSPSVPERTSPYRVKGGALVLSASGKDPESRYRRVPREACRLAHLEAPLDPPAALARP